LNIIKIKKEPLEMKYNIGITGTGSLVGQAILKSIIRSEYKDDYNLTGFDYFDNTVGSFWCESNFILPDLLKKHNEEAWINSIEDIITAKKLKVLFVGVDFELPFFAKYKQQIERKTGCIVIVSNEEVIKIGNDKYLTYLFLKDNGLSYPKTYLPEECDFSTLTYPLIVKPRIGARSIGVHKVKSIEELNIALRNVNGPIIQELIGDDSTEYTCGIISLNGKLQKSIALNRSLKDGNTFISEFKEDYPDSIYGYIESIAEKLGAFGACNLQLRIDAEGIPKLFEINPRHSGTTYIRALFGYNEVIFILKFIIENKELAFTLKPGKVIRHFEETLIN
jgi:carbamoyl-phosphate synthase large subunit